jgi:putative membrane protein
MLIGLILIGLIIYLFFNQKGSEVVSKTSHTIDALEIAKERLARGEITVEEYEMIKKTIM